MFLTLNLRMARQCQSPIKALKHIEQRAHRTGMQWRNLWSLSFDTKCHNRKTEILNLWQFRRFIISKTGLYNNKTQNNGLQKQTIYSERNICA